MIRKAILSAGLVICAFAYSQAQAPQRHKSMMQRESEYYSQFHFTEQWQWVKLLGRNPAAEKVPFQTQSNCTLKKRVFGWFPYWQAGTETNFQWNLISDLAYFDYTVSPTTGANTNSSFAWASSPAVTAALSHGVNAEITITLFSSHSTFLASSTAMTTCINNVISLLNSRGGKGVNIDFEGMASSDKAGFTAFMTQFKNALKAANSAYELSIALYAVDWGPVFDIPNLNNVIDLYIIMGYDYYYGGSTTAGPSDPLYDFQTGYNYDHSKSITAYLKAGVPLNKLLLGVPYYGETWATTAGTAPSATSGTGTSLIYNACQCKRQLFGRQHALGTKQLYSLFCIQLRRMASGLDRQ